MPFERNTHHTIKTREGSIDGRVTPHLLLTSDQGQMIIQDGEWYTAGGVAVEEDDVPQWAWDAAKSLSPETRESLGLEAVAFGEVAKKASTRPSIDVDAQSKGNTPMQLNASGPGGEAMDKAEPVPQGDSFPEDQPPKDAASPKAVAKGPPAPIVKK